MKIRFKLERETKGAWRFTECDSKGVLIDSIADAKIGTIYIRKSAMNPAPTFLRVEINPE